MGACRDTKDGGNAAISQEGRMEEKSEEGVGEEEELEEVLKSVTPAP